MTPPGPTDRREFVIATANPDKAQEIAEILGPAVTLLPRPAEVGEIEETGETLLDNARLKAHALAQATGRPAIADDTGLEVDELDGAPGVRSARYAGEHATYTENVAKLLAALDGLPGLRRARFRTVALAAWPDGREVVGEGAVEGVISREPRGGSGFGYDPVFIPTEGDGRTFAEMDPDEKNRISHRGRAFRDLTRQLPGPARPASPAAGRRDRWVDAAMALAVGLCVVVVHDVPYLLRHPFWLDEAWVADSTRAGIGSASFLTSSTPLGWTVLLRVVPGSGQQDLRLLPLAFAGLAAGAGYLFGREVFHGEHRLLQISAGVLTGAAVLLSPIMLLQDDLKQYTAEAFTTIALLVLVARLESRWSRRRLAAVALFAGLALLISNAVVFVGAAAMGGLAVECLVRRQWSRLRDVVVAAVVMVAIMLGLYELIVAPHVNSSLSSFWAPYYLPRHRGLSGALNWIHLRFLSLAHYFGFRRLSIDAAVCLLGLVALVWMRRVALAVMMPLTVVVLIVASAAKKYPFGDARTSTFWMVMAPVAMALAAAGVARLMTRLNVWAAVVPVAAALAIWVPLIHPDIRDHSLPNEDARSQLNYLDSHRQPNDVVILDWGASYAVAYYDRQLTPTFLHEDAVGVGFQPVYPHVPWLVEMLDRNASDVADALATAQADIEAEPANSRGRIWIIRSHVGTAEADAWAHDLAGKNVTTLPVGPEPLLLYQP